ncbi:MAG TPA: hypothetical protein VNY52_00630 [Solirubrobacteraceae bacterium]|jgi:hypothetical protein|nr:hypothetical protein [Solirubrobacteraceae bacterium]
MRPRVRIFLTALPTCACLITATTSGAATPTSTATSATIAPSLSPDRLGIRAALTFTIAYSGGESGIPSPVRHVVLQFPAGMTLDIPALRSCSAARLLAYGTSGCPAQSRLGRGHALVEGHLGAELVTEDVALWAFLGPPQNLQPTIEILAEGSQPVGEAMVLSAAVLSDRAPYGEELVMPIPQIATLPLEPDAAIVNFSLTIGTDRRRLARRTNTVLVPSHCPAGGLPFAAAFTYADGSSGSALATVPCPR